VHWVSCHYSQTTSAQLNGIWQKFPVHSTLNTTVDIQVIIKSEAVGTTHTNLLTPWGRVLLEKLTGFQLVKKFLAFYGTWMFITAFKSAHHLSVSWSDSISPGPRLTVWMFRNKINFYDELAPRPTSKLEDHPLSALCDCLFNIFAAALHVGGRSSIRNLRMRYAVATGTHLSQMIILL
jgi:hypothetical protein